MRRTLFVAVVTTSLSSLVGCNNSTTPSDAGTTNDSGTPSDAGYGGTLTTVSTANGLPAPYQSGNWQDFDPNNVDGGAVPYLNSLVEFTAPSTTSMATCPPPLSQPPYCNGFVAGTADGGSLLVQTYGFLGGTPSCSSDFSGFPAPTLRGVWSDVYNKANTANTDTFMISLSACSDLTGTGAYSGTGTPPSTPAGSQTVSALLASGASSGVIVTVSGVVTAYWTNSSGTEFGATIQDPPATAGGVGSPQSGLYVSKGSKSSSTSSHPSVGDYVTVQGIYKVYTNVGAGNVTTQQVNL
jgi:hypothetical protein